MLVNNPFNSPQAYIISDNILSEIGKTTAQNTKALTNGITGVKVHTGLDMSAIPVAAALFNPCHLNNRYTKFENLLISSISDCYK